MGDALVTDVLVPTVDLDGLDAAARLDDACSRVGFFNLAGHGLPDDVLGAMLDAAAGFFALPVAEKRHCVPPRPEVNRGWAPLGSESLAYSLGVDAPPDLFEAFNLGPEHADPNLWPERPDGFRHAMITYFDAVAAVARRLSALMAAALDLPSDFFVQRTTHAPDTLRVNWYETTTTVPEQQRMGAHTDYGILTVLYADPVPGLQILSPGGAWADVQPAPGCLLVNLGDLLAQWTNDRWRSTLHRVVPWEGRRRSAAFFHECNRDVLVSPLPSCIDDERPARYEPVLAGEHLMAKLMGPRQLRRSAATSTLGDRTVSS